MKGSRHGLRSLLGANAPLNGPICSSCRVHILQTRNASSAAAALAPSSIDDHVSSSTPEAPSPALAYQIRTGVVLSRPPQITRDLTPFEKSFYLYQRRLNERLALPAMQYFYYRPDTPAMIEFKKKRKARKGVATRDIGHYNPYAEDGWNDEVLIGDTLGENENVAKELIKDSVPLPKENEPEVDVEAHAKGLLNPRETEADKKNDTRSLARMLQRTLYLVVKDGTTGEWRFPEDGIVGRESLALAAERILTQTGGPNMNTWIVGNHPVGHRVLDYETPKSIEQKVEPQYPSTEATTMTVSNLGEKLFFMRARIMAGQADLKENVLGHKDFQWLAREELEPVVGGAYWRSVRNMLPAR